MHKCPVCSREHDAPETKAQNMETGREISLGFVCSLDCVAEMLYRLDRPDEACPGCPNCKPELFQHPQFSIPPMPEITS